MKHPCEMWVVHIVKNDKPCINGLIAFETRKFGAGVTTEARGSFIERNVMLGRQLVSRAHARNTATNNGNALALHRGGIK